MSAKTVAIPEKPSEAEKLALEGSFYIDVEHSCSACGYDEVQEDCEVCFGEIRYIESHLIPWDKIKEIRAAMVSMHQ